MLIFVIAMVTAMSQTYGFELRIMGSVVLYVAFIVKKNI